MKVINAGTPQTPLEFITLTHQTGVSISLKDPIGSAIHFQRDGYTVGVLKLIAGRVTFDGDIDATVAVFAEILHTLPTS